ncbi:hypothetical protein DUI87_33981 [Hirundo rustica rustica]|uniref:Uncharacterized protein n=1 Tax=Hirundo rustica rustica TaxID=333673 RepID=A0A3M0IKR8_HIRRU|nr:hypothetical protein DUI87_33981 [Hirundo rustica rustica]
MARAGAMSDGGVLLAALVLLLAAVAACWALGHWQPRRRQSRTPKRNNVPRVWPRGSRRNRGAPAAPRRSRPRATPGKRPRAPASPLHLSCCCRPCVAAAQELQELMLLHWARQGTCVPLYTGMWQALWKELEKLVKPGHLPCCGSFSSSQSLHPSKRLLPATFSIPGRASSLARMAQQRTPAIPAGSCGCQRPSILPGASAISDSLHPSQRLSETRPPAEGAEPVDRSPSSLGLTDFNSTGTTLTLNVARESPGVQVGAQPDAGELCQEQLAQQQASGSQQLSLHSSQDAVLAAPAVPAGNSLSLVVETILETPRKIVHLQEAAPPQPWTTSKASRGAGQKKELQDLYQRGRQLGSGGFGTVFSGIRLLDGRPVAIKCVARESVLQWVELPDDTRVPMEIVLMELQLTEGLHLKDDNWNFVSVDNSEQGTWPRVKGKLIVVGDCKHTPKEIEILPGAFDNNPGKFVLWLRCTHPPTFLPKGQTVAQIIPTWEHLEEDNIPTACPVHNITEVKPQVGCELQVGDEAINITGLLDTGADVTVIPAKHWPSRWALENVAGHVQGIGGMQLARQSKSVVQIKGPKGQLASLRPFVLDYREPLLGRDLMAQWGVTIDIPDPPQDFWAAVAEERPTHKLNWKTDAPVWVEQWPLSKQKLKALEELVEEQLAKGHIVETTSPWNSPVFVIRKPGKDKWRLLQDLRQINNVIEDMGSLQPGMPTPTMLPQNWKLAVIDIKDCFFHIPLHPDDAPRFAFSVPTVNREAPRKRYHWRVLPQGMKVSPIICQWYVASLLSPVRVAAEKAIIHHYMDDVLVCAPTDDVLSHALDLTINALVVAGFELQENKVQRMPPWRYLGLEIGKRTIVPQKLEIKAKIQTLADVHQLCGALNWVRPWLGLTTEDLAPLFNLLKGGEELSSPRELTPEAKEALEKVQHLMSTRQAHRCDPDLPFKFIIMGKLPHLHGVIFQWRNNIKKDQGREDPLLIIEWVFLSHQRSKRMTRPQELVAELIRKARVRIRELAGCDFECIHIPIGLRSGQITKAMLEHLLQENEALQFALDSFTGQISIHRPAHKIFNQDAKFTLNLKDVRSRKPLEALTVFTDASGKSHKSVMTWKDPQTQQWEADVAEVEGSPQVAELAAVVRAFERFPEPFNLVTDSAYVAGVVSRADQAILQEVSNTALFELLSKLVKLVSHREQPFFVMHTRSHTDLPEFIAEGNRRADALAAPAAMAPLPSIFEQAKLSHQLHHQNAPGLVRQFHITREQAKAIVATCPSCNQHALPTLSAGVNPRGLNSCELWQTDVTHIPQFGRSKYVHVSVDTFSGAVFASAHAGEKTLDAIKHLIQAFSFMGIPKELKTDNGPAYRSKEFCSFLQQWGVGHKTGIPHSPTGQAVVERTHREIKRVLNQQQPVLKTETPQTRSARALFTLNFLNSTFEFLNPPIVRHFGANPQLNIKERPPVMVRDPETGRTEGPHDLVTWGRGYACVSTPTGPRWLPSKWVRPYVPKVSGEKKKLPQVTQAAFRRKRREDFSPDGFAFLNDPCSNADCLF